MAATLAIVLAGAAVIWGIFRVLAWRFRAASVRDVDRALARQPSSVSTVTDAEVAHLPAPVARYLRAAGVVGNPRVQNFRVRMRGRIRADRPHAGFRSRPSSTTPSTTRRASST
jgi:hypothetical protein